MSLGRVRCLAIVASLVTILPLAAPPAVLAQDPVAESFCALFAPEEVGDIMGEPVEVLTAFESCDWSSAEPEGKFVFVAAYWASHTIDERMEIESGKELTVGGRRAWSAPDTLDLYIELDPGVLVLHGGTRKQLTKLGELAVPRAASLIPPAAPEPEPEPEVPVGDAELEALFPETIAGAPVTFAPGLGQLLLSSDQIRQAFDEALAGQGRTSDDVSLAEAGSAEPPYLIIALRVAGGDASVLPPAFLSMATEDTQQSPGEIGGKAVTLVTGESGSGALYASGEVLWIIMATDPILTEIISALP